MLFIGVFTFVLFSTIWRLMMNNYHLLHEIFLASRKSAKCFSLGFFFCAEVPRKWLIMCKFDNRLMEICWQNNLVSMPLFICGCPFSQKECQRHSACSFRVVAFSRHDFNFGSFLWNLESYSASSTNLSEISLI